MNTFGIVSAGISALGWCLLQFVWQAAVVGAVHACVRPLLPRGNPRYLAAMAALIVLAVCPLVTWHDIATGMVSGGSADMVVTGSSVALSPRAAPAVEGWQALVQDALPWLVLVWAIGVVALGARVFRQWRSLRSMLQMAETLPVWQARARAFAERMGLRRMVPVVASVRVATPILAGWIRPAVVLPLALLARMPASQIDLVLAHELAHLKRFDHVANLFQVVLETLFFYHPVVHWISRDARNERELCCDTLALQVTGGERRDFVAALASLEEFRAGHADLGVAASGGVLAERAWFIAGTAPKRPQRHVRTHAMLALTAVALVAAGWMWWRDAAWQQRAAALVAANNASVLRLAVQDVLQAPSLSIRDEIPATPSLLPVSYSAVSMPEATAAPATESGPAPSVSRPTLDPANLALHFAPIAAVPTRTLEPSAAPQPLYTVAPVYPPRALLDGIQGRVVVEFSLDAAGVPSELEVVDSSAGLFDAAALQALSSWRFAQPAVSGRRYRQAFTFRLDARAADDAAAARECHVPTGTHICRYVSDDDTGVRVSRPNR
jgi:TonB family protein